MSDFVAVQSALQGPVYSGSFTLPSSGRLTLEFPIEGAIDALPVYSANEYQYSMLQYLMQSLIEEGYHMCVRACPVTLQGSNAATSNQLAANASYEDQISVPEGSMLIAIGSIANNSLGAANQGFRFRIYDAGAQQYVSDSYIHSNNSGGRYNIPNSQPMLTTVKSGASLYILPSPFSVSSPGQLNVQIVNLNNVVTTIEMAFYFATPNGLTQVYRAYVEPNTIK